MEHAFWHRRWADRHIAFHEGKANALFVRHFATLGLASGSRVFVPLCGKTLDIPWLLGQGLSVVGVELSAIAIGELFAELGVVPTITPVGALVHHRAPGLDVFVGDFFSSTAALLGAVDAIYDRAALVALPEDMRQRYVDHLVGVTAGAAQLLITLEYDQSRMQGPPFSVTGEEVRRRYRGTHEVTELERAAVPGGLKGGVPTMETAWSLRPLAR